MGPNYQQYGRYGISGFGGAPPPPLPNVFGASTPSGPAQGALGAFIPLVSELVRQQTGIAGFTFGSDQNIATSLYARDYYQRLSQSRTAGAAADRDQIDLLLRGLFVSLGNRPEGTRGGRQFFDASGEAAIRELTGVVGGILPVAAGIAPDTVDAFLPRGSVAAAAGSFVNAGRFLRGPDGRPLNETADAARQVLEPLTTRGPGATAGLGAARLGQTFEALAAQGFIPGGEGVIDRSREKIAEYSKVVAGINDLFGDAGRTNAPIAELFEALQNLTGGGLGRLDSGQLTSSVRRLQAAAQLTPGGLAGVSAVAEIAQDQLRRSGATSLLTAPITAGALAAGQVFADRGLGGRGPESLTRDQFIELAARQQAAGAGSEIGNLFGGLVFQSQFVGADTDLGRAAAALKRGETTVTLGNGSTLDLRTARTDELVGLAARSGLDPGAFLAQFGNVAQNQTSFALNPNLRGAVDQAQQLDLQRSFNIAAQSLGLGDQDLGRIFDTALGLAGAGTADSSGDLATKTARLLKLQGLDLSAAQQGALGTVFGTRGLGLDQFQLLAQQTRRGIATQEGVFSAKGLAFDLLSPLARGGFSRNIATAIANLGITGLGAGGAQDSGLVQTFLTGLGGVSERTLSQTLSPLSAALGAYAPDVRKAIEGLTGGLTDRGGTAPQAVLGGVGGLLAGAAGAAATGGAAGGLRPIVINVTGNLNLDGAKKQIRGEGSVGP